MKRVAPVCFILLLTTLAGCGGGSGGVLGHLSTLPTTTRHRTAVPRITIAWGERSRSIGALSSALSATVRLQGAKPDGSDLRFTVDRLAVPASYSIAVKAPEAVSLGNWPLTVTFFARTGGDGAVVGTAEAIAEVDMDGTLPDVAVASAIKRVEILPDQQVLVGERCDLRWAAYDKEDALVAVTPGSAMMTFLHDTDCLRLIDGQLEGMVPGTAPLVVLVDGISSPVMPVQVIAK